MITPLKMEDKGIRWEGHEIKKGRAGGPGGKEREYLMGLAS